MVRLLQRRTLIAFMLYGEVAKSRATEPTFRPDRLVLQPRTGMQATFVEHLRVECADERMQSPSLREEKTAVRGHPRVRAEDMVEPRDVHRLRLATRQRLAAVQGLATVA